ncbi:MAG: class I SAM-dependent RNA methyltransferase [Deltaproteobacteria bacterium]|nr:class I SAM-dependent RNA methyltransferase [Deltaproteobacteria bacterium]
MSRAGPPHACFAVCAPGLEALLAAELRALGIRPGRPDRGGVPFDATTRQLYAANVFLRTATRVLLRLASFDAPSFAVLEREARRVPWDQWLAPGAPVAISASSSASRLYHTGAVAERLSAVLTGPVLSPPDQELDPIDPPTTRPDRPPLHLLVRLLHDHCVLSIDSSGEPLHRRGWRLETAKAPLRETLAAAMILASGWDGLTPLLDPLCGSGTIAIEAALLARGIAPGHAREFAFQKWPSFAPGTFASVRGEVRTRARPDRPVVIVASDRDPGAIRAAVANAERAGVADAVTFLCRPLAGLDPFPLPHQELPPSNPPSTRPDQPTPPSRPWLLSNPPYGRRVGGADLGDLYASLGAVVRGRLPGFAVGLLVADDRLARRTGLRLAPLFTTSNGGLRVRFVATAPVAGKGLPR